MPDKRVRVAKPVDPEFVEFTSKPDSVTINKLAKGYSWTIKIYEDLQGGKGSHALMLKKIQQIDKELRKTYGR